MKEDFISYNRVSVDDADRKRLRHFQSEVFGIQEVEEDDFTEMLCKKNVRGIRLVAVFVILFVLTLGIWDMVTGFSTQPSVLLLEVLLILLSVHMIVAPRRINKCAGRRVRYAFIIYYVFLQACVTYMTILRDMLADYGDLEEAFLGVPIITCLIALYIFAPLVFPIDNMILLASFVIGMFLPMIPSLGGANYVFRDQILIRIGISLGYLYFWNENRRITNNTIALKNLSWEMMVADYMDVTTKQLNSYAMKTYWNYLCQIAPKSVGVLRCDIDNFRRYNDVCGHLKGDDALREISQAMNRYLWENGWYLFRVEGDEFTILIPNAEIDLVWEVGSKLCQIVNDGKFFIPDEECNMLTMTVGCAMEPMALTHNEDFMQRAERQLEEGKKTRNAVVFLNEIRSIS